MRTTNITYRAAFVLALATSFLLVWMIAAVGVLGREGDGADLMYIGAFAAGIIGALIACLRLRGMARALLVTALAQALVTVIALIAGVHKAPHSSVGEVLGLNGFFVLLFVASAWLFQIAARDQTLTGTGPQREND